MAIVSKTNENIKTLIDLCIEIYGNTKYIFQLIDDNPIFTSVQDLVTVGMVITYDDELVFRESTIVNIDDLPPETSSIKQIEVRQNQTLFDMAIQMYGRVEDAFTIITDNPVIDNLNNNYIAGLNMIYTEQLSALPVYFKQNNIYITTGNNNNRSFDDSFDYSFN